MTDRLHLKPQHRAILEALFREHLPDVEVWAYGSRINGRSHDGSDLDLVLRGPDLAEIPFDQLLDFEEALRESTIPFIVEVRDWARLPERFHREIKREYLTLFAIDDQYAIDQNNETIQTMLGRCAHLVRNMVQPADVPNFPYIGLEHIGEGSMHLVGQGTSNDVESTKNRFQKGDTLFGKLRPYFRKVVRAPFDGICSTDIWIIRANKNADQRFIHYCLASRDFVDFVNLRSEGTRMPRATWECASEYEISLPPLPEQCAIAHILGTLDDKIELNRRMNETLETMARAIFQDWFVDFGPVRAKSEEREPYLPAEIWNLFPNKLDNEGKPVGWQCGTIGGCFQLTMGQSPPGETYNVDQIGTPFFQGRTDFGFRYPDNRKYCTAPTRIARPDDTLVSVRAPVGDINMAWEECSIGRGVATLRHLSGSRAFTYYSLWAIQQELRQYEHTGTVFGAITKRQFESLGVVEPQPELISSFDSQIIPLDELIKKNTAENRTLIQMRDLLLPKLISGEIRLHEAEQAIKSVA